MRHGLFQILIYTVVLILKIPVKIRSKAPAPKRAPKVAMLPQAIEDKPTTRRPMLAAIAK